MTDSQALSEAGVRVRSERRLKPHVIVDGIAIAGVLGAMVVANVEWLFTREGWLDTWMYFGFFRHYDIASYLDTNKKIGRLPWILLGYVVNKLFSPEIAAFVLHLGSFALGAAAFYWLAQKRFGREAAIIAALAYVTWVPLQGSGGWDYHNTVTPVCYFLAYLSLRDAARTPQRPFMNFFKCGALFAVTLHTNILVILLIPSLFIQIAHGIRVWSGSGTKTLGSWLGHAFAGTLAGGLGLTVLLGLINLAFGRSFFFFLPLLSVSAHLLGNPDLEKSWWLPWSDGWWINSFHTAMTDAVLAVVVARLILGVRSLKGLLSSDAGCAMAEFALSVGVFAFGQSLGHPLLQPFYMAMPLAMPMFLALAGLISDIGISAGRDNKSAVIGGPLSTAFVVFAALTFGLQFLGHLTVGSNIMGWVPHAWSNLPAILFVLAGFLGANVVAYAPSRLLTAQQRLILAFGWIVLTLGQANAFSPIAPIDDRSPYDYRVRCTAHRSILSDIAEADDILFPIARAGKRVIVWWKGPWLGPYNFCTVRASNIGVPLVAMGYGALEPDSTMEGVSTITDAAAAQLRPGADVLAVVSDDEDLAARIAQRLQQTDPRWHIVASRLLGQFDFRFHFSLISTSAQSSPR